MQMSGQTLVLKTKTKAVGSPGHFSSASRTRWGKVEGGKHLGKLTASCTPGCIDILIPGVWVPFPSGPPLVRGSKKVAKDLPFCLQPLTTEGSRVSESSSNTPREAQSTALSLGPLGAEWVNWNLGPAQAAASCIIDVLPGHGDE